MSKDVAMSLWEHINELAKRMKVVLVTFIVSMVIILLVPGNLNFIQNPEDFEPWVAIFLTQIRGTVLPSNIQLIALSLEDPIELYVIAAFAISVAVTLPVLAYEVYKFVDPALHSNERGEIYPFVGSVIGLFIGGALFGFFVLFPFFVWSLLPFFSALQLTPLLSVTEFYNMLFFTILTTGLAFTIPAFFVLLVKYGILKTTIFSKNRKWAYLGLGILALFMSPGASPQGNLFLFLPMLFLFEGAIFFGQRYEKKGEIHTINWFSDPKCKYCKEPVPYKTAFCPKCLKSQN